MVAIPISSTDIDMKEYWQVKALSVEWLYVLQKLKDSVAAKDIDRHCVVGTTYDGDTIYMLRKKFYTAGAIAKATGLTVDKLEKYEGIITLKQPKSSEGLPDATVEGWGTA